MEKIDYGDINKFLVSVGIVLIGLSIVTPYLYLKEDFGLYIELETFEKFQEPVKILILSKQNQVTKIQDLLPFISISLFLFGLTSFIIGLVRWFKRQSKLDEKFDKEIQKLDLEIESLTPEEKEKKIKEEVNEIEIEEQMQSETTTTTTSATTTTTTTIPDSSQAYTDYLNIEKGIIEVFENYKSPNFDILPLQLIGNKFEVDIFLKAKNKKYLDRIVEIKYFRNQPSLSIILKSLNRINTTLSYYREATNRKALPVLLVVYNRDKTSIENIIEYQNELMDYSQNIPELNRLKMEFIDEKELKKFNVQRILKK